MTDSIETSEREACQVKDPGNIRMALPASIDAALIRGDQAAPAADQPTARRLQELRDAVRLALVLLKDDHARPEDYDLVVAELERVAGLPSPTRLEQAP